MAYVANSDGKRVAAKKKEPGMMPQFGTNQNLPVIDILKHPGIWAVLDEACNNNCHGSVWARNAEAKLAQLEMTTKWVHRKVKKYDGIGAHARACGKLQIPFAMKMLGCILPGMIDSYEIENSGHSLL